MKNRGDQRIGQALINAVCHEYRGRITELDEDHRLAAELILFNIEDDDLVEAVENYTQRG